MIYTDPTPSDAPISATGARLLAEIEAALPRLLAIDDSTAGQSNDAGKWSPKEVLGHLIDSAANNHQRFIRAQSGASVVDPGYAQVHWVQSQQYGRRSWRDIVDFWAAYNRHLAHVLTHYPESRRSIGCQVGDGEPVPLEFVARDYVGHLRHHLGQVLGVPDAGQQIP